MDTRPPPRRPNLEPFAQWAARVKTACADDCEALFTLAFGEPERRNAATWRAKASPAVTMEAKGRKRGAWVDHRSGEGGGPLELFALAVMGQSGKPKGEAYKEAIAEAALHYGVTRDGAEAQPLSPAEQEQRRRAREEAAAERARKAASDSQEEARAEREIRRSAAEIARAAVPLDDPSAEPARRYLTARRLSVPPSPDLRFLRAGAFSAAAKMRGVASPEAPALVLILRDAEGQGAAVQRITLLPDGSDRDRERGKLYTGAAKAAEPFRLPARPDDVTGGGLILAEGFESAAALWTATGAEVWAGLDATGLTRAIEAAPASRRVIIASDRDALGNPARATIDEACAALALRHPDAWRAMPSAELIPIPAPDAEGKVRDGADAADLLKRHGAEAVRRMIAEAPPILRPPSGPKPDDPAAEPPAWLDDAPPPSPEDYGAEPKPDHAANFKTTLHILPPDPNAPELLEPEEAARRVSEKVAAFFTQAATATPETARTLAIRMTAGGGKSEAARREAAKAARAGAFGPRQIIFASPTQKLSAEAFEGFRRDFPDVSAALALGRGQKDPETGEALCGRYDEVQLVQSMTFSVQAAMCEQRNAEGMVTAQCPLFAICAERGYQRRKAEAEAAAVVFVTHAHLAHIARKAERDPDTAPGLIIIDEDATAERVESRNFSFQALAQETPLAHYDAREWKTPAQAAEAEAALAKIGAALDARLDLAQMIVLRALMKGANIIDALKAEGFTAEHVETFAEAQAARIPRARLHPEMTAEQIERATKQVEKAAKASHAAPLLRLWRLIGRDWEQGETRAITLYLERAGDPATTRIRLDWAEPPMKGVPTLILDATLSRAILERMHPGAEVFEVRARENAVKIQIYDRAVSNTWQTGGRAPTEKSEAAAKRHRATVRHIMRAMAAHVGGSQHIAFASPSAALRLHLADAGTPAPEDATPGALLDHPLEGVQLLPFGPHMRGLDAFKDKRALQIVGRNRPPPHEIEAKARAIFHDGPPLSFERSKKLTPYPAAPGAERKATERETYDDPRVAAIEEDFASAMTAQTAGRLRAVHRKGKPAVIVLICNEPCADFIPDELLELGEVTPGRILRAYLLAGRDQAAQRVASACELEPSPWPRVFDLSPKGLSEAAPEEFETPKAAKRHLEEADRLRPQTPKGISIRGMGPQSGSARLEGFAPASPPLPAELGPVARELLADPLRPRGIGLFVSFRREGWKGSASQALLATCDAAEGEAWLAAWLEGRGERLKAGSFRVIFDLCAHDGGLAPEQPHDDPPPPSPRPPSHDGADWSPPPLRGTIPYSGGLSLAETAEPLRGTPTQSGAEPQGLRKKNCEVPKPAELRQNFAEVSKPAPLAYRVQRPAFAPEPEGIALAPPMPSHEGWALKLADFFLDEAESAAFLAQEAARRARLDRARAAIMRTEALTWDAVRLGAISEAEAAAHAAFLRTIREGLTWPTR